MQAIDYNAIEKNAQYFKQTLGSSKLCAVLKNNAYGHGLVHVARHLAQLADYFAVGNVDEAEQVQFLRKDTLILLPQSQRNTARGVMGEYVLTVDSFTTLKLVDVEARKAQKVARVHVKFDSGMSRLGFNYAQIELLLNRLREAQVVVEGVFSHFYGDTVEECDKQFAYFVDCAKAMEQALGRPLLKHIANTGATLLSPKYHLDMARIGLGLFGYGDKRLSPAKNVYADVIAIKKVEANSVVGYGAKYITTKATQITVLNVGYATGLPRALVGAKVRIGNQLFPIVAICMAMTLIDVGDTETHVGELATMLGDGINIANDEVIIYELLCNLK